MTTQFINTPESDFGFGIDSRSAENQIKPGHVRDLLNGDVVEKRVRKRTGYQGYAGNLPIRVSKMEYSSSEKRIYFTLLNTDLSAVRSTPLVIFGKSSSIATGGPFTTAGSTCKYYTGFTVPTRKILANGSGLQTLSIDSTEVGLNTTNIFMQVVQATSPSNRSYSASLLVNDMAVDDSTFGLTFQYVNDTTNNIPVYTYYKDVNNHAGLSYVATLSHGGGGSQTFTIAAGTHNLNNFDIVAQVQQDNGGTSRSLVNPESIIIHSNGTVEVTLNSSSATSFYLLLASAAGSNLQTKGIPSNTTASITIPNLTTPWLFFSLYSFDSGTGNLTQILPNSISYDDSTQTATLSVTNSMASPMNLTAVWTEGFTGGNRLYVSDASISVDATDSRPQLTIWGLDYIDVFPSNTGRSSWVTHLDSYKAPLNRRLVSGIGGNLFAVRSYSEAGATYKYPLLYPRLQERVNANITLGPVFWDSGETPARSGGYITSDSSGTHWASITSVAYDAGTGYTKYTLSLPSKQILDSSGAPTSLSSVVSTTTDLEDWLTVQGMSFAKHEGTFKIKQVTDGSNQIVVSVVNTAINSSDYDDTSTAGEAGIFTGKLAFQANSPFIPGDRLVSSALENTFICSCLSSSGTSSVIDGLTDSLELSAGLLVGGMRTSRVLSLRTEQTTAIASSTNLVHGDMLSYTPIDRLLRVVNINPNDDLAIHVSGNGTTATVVIDSVTTDSLDLGMYILLTQADGFSGVHQILEILDAFTFTFASTVVGAVTGTLAGHTIEVDEELQWEDAASDSSAFQVLARWIPIEAPTSAGNLPRQTAIHHLDSNSAISQPFLRSTMVVDNMYLTNSSDEVMKFDGLNISRAGLFPWQPGLFLTQNTAATAKVVTNLRNVTYTSAGADQGRILLANPQDVNVVPIGKNVRLSGSTESYTVTGYAADPSVAGYQYMYLDRSLDANVSLTGSASEIGVYRYYYRLNAVDANQNIIASAVTGYQDHVIELTANAAIQHKIIGMPTWDIYDYDRLEVEIYRTLQDQPAPFYKITTIPMSFNNTLGYINYSDSFTDSDLLDLDAVNTALKGAELGISWQEPLRAKYTTALGNRLVLGNITDYPQLDIQVVAPGNVTASNYAGMIFTFRKDNTDSGTTTDNVNRVRYQLVNGSSLNASSFVIGTNQFSFTAATLPGSVAVGDWIYLHYGTVATAARDITYSGWWQIAGVSGTTVTVNLVGAASAGSYPDKYAIATDSRDVPVILDVDGNMGMVNGDSFDLFDLGRRLSMAINTSMRMVDTSLAGMSGFIPWLTARGGNDVGRSGRIVVRQPRTDTTSMEVQLPASIPTGVELFVNNIRRSTSDQVSASARLYPSRILVSYENYPEIMDNPTATIDAESTSAMDINSADGQEITGIIPFFGSAAFGAAQQSAILVVFKQNSIYLVDFNEKLASRNALQRIESEGLGCTAPYSIAVTRNGIMFANESGLYCLRRDQSIQYIGKYVERNWLEGVDRDQLNLAQGHHYGIGRSYKISVPLLGDTSNSEVLVYNHTTEQYSAEGLGAWSRYDNHPATGWANLDSDAFFASTKGRVFSLRRTGSKTDYRDDSQAIDFLLDTRPLDMGSSGLRKLLDRIIINYRSLVRNIGTSVSVSVETDQLFHPTTPLIIPIKSTTSGIDDVSNRDITQITHNPGREQRRGVYFQIRVENASLDENLEVAGIDLRIGGLTAKGILQAKTTQRK